MMNNNKVMQMSVRFVQSVKPHVPSIKFRKGVTPDSTTNNYVNENQTVNIVRDIPKVKSVSRPVIEDYQLPNKYRRRPLDQVEIDVINSGGAW